MGSVPVAEQSTLPPPHNIGAHDTLLRLRNLAVDLRVGRSRLSIIQDVGFTIAAGERVGMVGESGCGKTITGLAILGLLPLAAFRPTGEIWFEGRDLLALSEAAMRSVRGRRIGMIFQEPMSALDPVFTIGEQISETVRAHLGLGHRPSRTLAIEALAAVGIPAPERRYDEYPHQLSGGMRQRAMIAMAIVCEPALLIADEPTTALDVTVQAQIIELLVKLTDRAGTALLFISHDLGVVAEACNRVITMYAGQVVEDAPVDDLLTRPRHPYSSDLLRSLPRRSVRKTRLPSIPGRVPTPEAMPPGCRFATRCTHALAQCDTPQLLEPVGSGAVRCGRHAELQLTGTVT
jgi:peptide/nickel transport system ATP-binding protein